MKPAVEDKLFSFGCIAVLLSVTVLVGLAITRNWSYSLVAILLIMGWFKILGIRGQADRKIEQETLEEIFQKAGCPIPVLKRDRGSSYGYPTFTLVFKTKVDYDQAEVAGCIKAYKEFIQSRYAHIGAGQRPFEVDLALDCKLDENVPPKVPSYLKKDTLA